MCDEYIKYKRGGATLNLIVPYFYSERFFKSESRELILVDAKELRGQRRETRRIRVKECTIRENALR